MSTTAREVHGLIEQVVLHCARQPLAWYGDGHPGVLFVVGDNAYKKKHYAFANLAKFDAKPASSRNHRMKYGEYSWQSPQWPVWRYDFAVLTQALGTVSRAC